MEFIQKNKKWLGVLSLLVIVFLLFLYQSNVNQETQQTSIDSLLLEDSAVTDQVSASEESVENQKEVEVIPNLVIDVKGAVTAPGVYEMEPGNRIHHVISKAGGLTKEANELLINLAAPLEDGMVIYVPKQGEEQAMPALVQGNSANPSSPSSEGMVNINQATSEQLQTLTGIGPSKAEAILSYREENGLFKSIEDLKNVSGIGEKTFEKLKEEITIN
ncbi:helix-hairpin-helix domain-containing protein [Metabacillus herbersteinensis]|uniref:Helix-hairpin-helix domain-containing protein n=1 Tax=Metabacillus herbersteinensis TaxID=283816 RepID=A0ABV6G8S6_9BACI